MREKKKKTRETPERQRRRVDRREVMRTLALGAGGAVLASTVLGGEDPEPELNGQYFVENDGYGYLIIGFTAQEGWWLVDFGNGDQENGVNGGVYAINPAGHVFDSGFWWPMNEFTNEGVYFDGFDDNIYLHLPELTWVDNAIVIDSA
jgi:hypothetical protein